MRTGEEFRKFIKTDGFIQQQARAIYKAGERQPDFLAIYLWSNVLLTSYNPDAFMILDGLPRSRPEAEILETVFPFLGRRQIFVVYLEVSNPEVTNRMLKRGREDDNHKEIGKRLQWFETDVAPALEYFRSTPLYTFLEVNGEGTREEVHERVVKELERLGFKI